MKNLPGISTPFLDGLMKIISMFGEMYIVLAFLIIFYFAYNKEIAKKIIFVIFTSGLINNSLKGIVKYPRPFVYEPSLKANNTATATGFSFPSGHSQNGATLYSSIALNGQLHKHCKLSKKAIWIICIILIGIIGFSRMYFAVHYPKDVIVGIILGIGSTFIFSYIYDKVNTCFKNELCLYIIIALVFLPFITIFYHSTFSEIKIFRDFYLAYALLLGYIPALIIDHKYVNFNCNTSFKKICFRLMGAVLCFIIL